MSEARMSVDISAPVSCSPPVTRQVAKAISLEPGGSMRPLFAANPPSGPLTTRADGCFYDSASGTWLFKMRIRFCITILPSWKRSCFAPKPTKVSVTMPDICTTSTQSYGSAREEISRKRLIAGHGFVLPGRMLRGATENRRYKTRSSLVSSPIGKNPTLSIPSPPPMRNPATLIQPSVTRSKRLLEKLLRLRLESARRNYLPTSCVVPIGEQSDMFTTDAELCAAALGCNPIWDPIRKDPRFEKAIASLASKELI